MSVALLKSQDVLLLCKLIVLDKDQKFRQLDLSTSLGINQSEVSTGYDRLIKSHLLDQEARTPNKMMAFEFLESAVKFFFPAETTDYTVGIPTSIFAKPLLNVISEKGVPLVWADAQGSVKGIGLKPIHESVPHAITNDQKLYEILSVLDAIRTFKPGRVKEQAEFLLRKTVFGSKNE